MVYTAIQTMTPTTPALAILVTDSSSAAERLTAMLTAVRCRVLAVADWETAEARIFGGGVSLVVLRLSPSAETDRIWDAVAALHKRDAELPIVVVCDLPAALVPEGVPVVQEADLVSTAQTLFERRRNPAQRSGREEPSCVVAVLGVKGGVGTSTVALNLAAVLAGRGKTILAEIRQTPGTLAPQLGLHRPVRTVADQSRSRESPRAADVQDALWTCHQIPGLSVLFGPQSFDSSADWPDRVGPILSFAAQIADYVVVDLPHSLSSLHRAALPVTDHLLLVLERDALCLHAGKLMLQAIEAEKPALRQELARWWSTAFRCYAPGGIAGNRARAEHSGANLGTGSRRSLPQGVSGAEVRGDTRSRELGGGQYDTPRGVPTGGAARKNAGARMTIAAFVLPQSAGGDQFVQNLNIPMERTIGGNWRRDLPDARAHLFERGAGLQRLQQTGATPAQAGAKLPMTGTRSACFSRRAEFYPPRSSPC